AQVVALLIAGVLLIAAFLAWERRAADPMLPLRLFGSRAFAAANVTGFLMAGSIFSAAFLMAQYFQFALGYSPLAAGLRLLPWTATPLLLARIAGVLSDRFGAAFAIAIAAAVFAANGHLGTPVSFTAGFRPALAVVAGLSVLGALSALALNGRRAMPAVALPERVDATASVA